MERLPCILQNIRKGKYLTDWSDEYIPPCDNFDTKSKQLSHQRVGSRLTVESYRNYLLEVKETHHLW